MILKKSISPKADALNLSTADNGKSVIPKNQESRRKNKTCSPVGSHFYSSRLTYIITYADNGRRIAKPAIHRRTKPCPKTGPRLGKKKTFRH
jgi:hypothetical protein